MIVLGVILLSLGLFVISIYRSFFRTLIGAQILLLGVGALLLSMPQSPEVEALGVEWLLPVVLMGGTVQLVFGYGMVLRTLYLKKTTDLGQFAQADTLQETGDPR